MKICDKLETSANNHFQHIKLKNGIEKDLINKTSQLIDQAEQNLSALNSTFLNRFGKQIEQIESSQEKFVRKWDISF
jgi:hypothetical protein